MPKPGARAKARAAEYWKCPDCRVAVACGRECWRCGNPERPIEVKCRSCGWRGPVADTGVCAGCGNLAVRQEPNDDERMASNGQSW